MDLDVQFLNLCTIKSRYLLKLKGVGDINSALLRKGTLKTKKIIQLCDINAQYTLFFTLEHEKNTLSYKLEICVCKVEKKSVGHQLRFA